MCESPSNKINYPKVISSGGRNLINTTEGTITRDPFANLMKIGIMKLSPLSPLIKLPKLQAVLPPRHPLQMKKSETQSNLNYLNSPRSPKSDLESPSEFPFEKKIKAKRIKLKSSLSNAENTSQRMITKKRNSFIVLDFENDVTFGQVGRIITKDII